VARSIENKASNRRTLGKVLLSQLEGSR